MLASDNSFGETISNLAKEEEHIDGYKFKHKTNLHTDIVKNMTKTLYGEDRESEFKKYIDE